MATIYTFSNIMKSLALLFALFVSFNSYANCLSDAETASEMHNCLTSELEIERELMHKALEMTYETSSGDLLYEIRQSQRDWIKYRDTHCSIVRQRYSQGDVGVIAFPLCLLDMTQLRTEELRTIIGR